MRSPISSSPQSNEQTGHDGHDGESAHVDPRHRAEKRVGDGIVLPKPDQPLEPWQRAFILGPNVRFTRTPESVIAKRREEEAAMEQAMMARLAAEQAAAKERAALAVIEQRLDEQRQDEHRVQLPPPVPVFLGVPKTGNPLIVPKRNPPPRPAEKMETAKPVPVSQVADEAQTPAEPVQPVIDLAPQFAPTVSSVVPSSLAVSSAPDVVEAPVAPSPEAIRLRQAAAAMRMAESIDLHLTDEDRMPTAAPTHEELAGMPTASAAALLPISDFAFFDLMPDLIVPQEKPDPVAAPAPATVTAQAMPESVVATVAVVPEVAPVVVPAQKEEKPSLSVAELYREIKLRHGFGPAPEVTPEQNRAQAEAQPVEAQSASDEAPVVQEPPATVETEQQVSIAAQTADPEPVQPVSLLPEAAPIVLTRVMEIPALTPASFFSPMLPQAEPAGEPQPEPETAKPQEASQRVKSGEDARANRLPGGLEINRTHPRDGDFVFPSIGLLQEPPASRGEAMQPEALEQSAGLLESVLEDFGIRGEVIDVRPGPVVTLYEFEPAPGIKSSRIIGLADDIARSMSALSARVAVVPGRNVIGIELPNAVRETVYLRELVECEDYWETRYKLALCLGKSIGGEPVIAELAKMPHLLVAGTTGSGKSVAINTMILSLLYRLKPEECRLIMVDPKMLELSVYDGIPHLLTPVVTDPKKAVMALKWAVREMEDRYRKMSRLGVRNIDGYNARAAQAREKGEIITVSVQSGFDRNSGELLYEEQELDLSHMPYIVIIVDEMADLMMVAGKEIEGAIQRLAQMARAAGIHLIMATQRPSVDVITGTIKANFPTRISFQVTSKIDSRTILGEQGAEHLLGQGDMLQMVGGGRIQRVHGPFVSDAEVEHVVAHLKTQGRPEYLGTVTEDETAEAPPAIEDTMDRASVGSSDDGDDLYEKAVKVVLRDQKCSTSYIQRRLSVGYNRAASLVERMEKEGLVGPANHVGKREIIAGSAAQAPSDIGYDDGE
ncbi:FtsK/SpoIIIE domain-containing protein [Allorhizobium sp. BGMRC 0089]|uniref:DNA translocase FtsK n=1 Tax=Allorhizobium sonneratiae TaxID=2934936 RepID=UPI002034773A|nr:DNA translocase FtsK [Allorhizobium sonneratiae]MCM2293241.1 FtsK/SpoIIIE domain-containing protein [Allorhizobium sonneratiae]